MSNWALEYHGEEDIYAKSSKVVEFVDLVSDSEMLDIDDSQDSETATSNIRVVIFGLATPNEELAGRISKGRVPKVQGENAKEINIFSQMESHWIISKSGYVKVNVYGCYSSIAMMNDNKTGVGVVLRDDRVDDPNMHMKVTYLHQAANNLGTYLAQNGEETKEDMFQTSEPFGRVLEIWHEDMGLRPVGVKFRRDKETFVGAWVASRFALNTLVYL
ncbi:hypothetical protein POM88_024010 [Heracleum sosnowskyi]|uniref:Uncharacterized protein n=1 Tax=Heracleum sosnowskyi TaxID=360622 RepID=A0AAD8ILS8_9APIA|nr:hypothetical protein POM88_024010 [Heracleum sosnowskyi]